MDLCLLGHVCLSVHVCMCVGVGVACACKEYLSWY